MKLHSGVTCYLLTQQEYCSAIMLSQAWTLSRKSPMSLCLRNPVCSLRNKQAN
jgi:hypothetical protein